MMLGLACAALLLVTLGALVAPLLRRRGAAPGGFDRDVYRAQLAELEEDRARGVIGAEEAEAARAEIARRLLATDRAVAPATAASGTSPALAAALAATLAVGGAGMYLLKGAPSLQPHAETDAQAALTERAESLAATIARDPNNVEALLNFARIASGLGRWSAAAEAYRKVLVLRPGVPPAQAALGEALTMEAGGNVTAEARAAFRAAPDELASRFYLPLADAQSGDAPAAIAAWQKLAADLPPDAPIRAELATRIAQAAKSAGLPAPALPVGTGPAAAAVAAADTMSPQERETMIRGMVARLADRLATTPDDVEGWVRLGRAYLVIGEPDKSATAYDRAAALRPGADIRLQEIAAIFEATPPPAKLPARLRTLLEQVATSSPDLPELLWYQGMIAARSGERDVALRLWQSLLPRLPEASEERRLVQTAIDALQNRGPTP